MAVPQVCTSFIFLSSQFIYHNLETLQSKKHNNKDIEVYNCVRIREVFLLESGAY
jgi:hypothetical protein